MSDLQSFAKAVKKFDKLEDSRKETTNACNRFKTELKNMFISFLKENSLPIGTGIRVDNRIFKMSVTEEEVIPASAWFALYKKKEITEDQFIKAIRVGKAEAKNAIGADQVLLLQETIRGKTPDLRIEAAKPGYSGAVEVIQPIQKLKKRLLSKPTMLTKKPIRKIKLGA